MEDERNIKTALLWKLESRRGDRERRNRWIGLAEKYLEERTANHRTQENIDMVTIGGAPMIITMDDLYNLLVPLTAFSNPDVDNEVQQMVMNDNTPGVSIKADESERATLSGKDSSPT
ncbi:hypothetical protein FQA39_LY02071 [Lamprigera yunnana]|nr:hypothetical protein FQA39_LY02071 [Lamprigera yunnana]